MAKFCSKCGTKLDETTGLCPKCDAEKIKKNDDIGTDPNQTLTKKELKKRKKKEKKRIRKTQKKNNRAQWSLGKRIRRFILKAFLFILLFIILAIGIIGILIYLKIIKIPDISDLYLMSEVNSDQQKTFDNGDYIYIPGGDKIEYNKETGAVYYKDLLTVYTIGDFSKEEAEKLAESVNGVLVGDISGSINVLQIYAESNTFEELQKKAQELMKDDSVLYAGYSYPIQINENINDNNTWELDGIIENEKGNENNPNGNDWWAEAIGVYKVWNMNQDTKEVRIGIIDSGFDFGHEDLKGKINFLDEFKTNSETDHGTHVAGIISANNNDIGIRGIIDNAKLFCVDWSPTENSSYLSSGEYIEITKQLIENKLKVINNSWGSSLKSKRKYIQDLYGESNELYYYLQYLYTCIFGGYSEYVKSYEASVQATGMDCMLMIIETLLNEQENRDYLIVQSAGNGYDNAGPGIDAKKNACYCAIDEELYNMLPESTKKQNQERKITFEDIDKRILIVGAVANTRDSKGNYEMTYSSNYGNNVDICAPGEDILSTITNNRYQKFSGTSMAAPMVTASAAYLWSINPTLSAEEVREILLKNSVVNANGVEKGKRYPKPMLNIGKAVESITTPSAGNDRTDTSDIPSDAVEFNGHYYYLYDSGTASSYEEALQYCQDKGGYLATLTSQEENDFVYAYLGYKNCANAYFGLSDAANEGTWEWCTGEEVSYTNWNSGEPNGENPEEDYGEFYFKYPDGKWNDGDFGNSTAGDNNAFLCEWGDYTVQQTGGSGGQKTTSDERDIVLVLDASGSMAGTPLEETKKASSKFINTVLEQDASIGIVTYDEIANRASEFSMNQSALQNAVSEVGDGGGTNIEAGLYEAQTMLQTSNAKKKIIVLMSDGEPNNGKVGENLIAYADEIKKEGILIYTIGFFESLTEKSDAQRLMEQLASDGCHYEVAKADDLVFFFEDMADQINGQKYIYVRIACPVDVSVTYNGQTLSSSDRDSNFRTDFGTLTFEEKEVDSSEEAEEDYEETGEIDDRIKVLRLKEGVDYDLKLTGTGRGVMNYTIGFMDEDGNYSDLRKFKNIRVSRRTTIDTVAAVSPESILNIDEDGDGKYDIKMRAEENGYGEEIKTPAWVIYAMCVAGILIVIDIFIIVILRATKKRKVRR